MMQKILYILFLHSFDLNVFRKYSRFSPVFGACMFQIDIYNAYFSAF